MFRFAFTRFDRVVKLWQLVRFVPKVSFPSKRSTLRWRFSSCVPVLFVAVADINFGIIYWTSSLGTNLVTVVHSRWRGAYAEQKQPLTTHRSRLGVRTGLWAYSGCGGLLEKWFTEHAVAPLLKPYKSSKNMDWNIA